MDDESEVIARKPVCDELCRLCANTDKQLIPIFQGEGVEHNLSDQIKKYLPIIKVTEIDKLPLQVCYQCTSTLIAWHNFFEQCRVADSRLREILPSSEKFNQDDDPYHDYTDDFRDDSESQSPVIEKKDEASVTVSIIDSSQRMETNDIVSSIKSKEDDKSESETLCENRSSAFVEEKWDPLSITPQSSTLFAEDRAKLVKNKKFGSLMKTFKDDDVDILACNLCNAFFIEKEHYEKHKISHATGNPEDYNVSQATTLAKAYHWPSFKPKLLTRKDGSECSAGRSSWSRKKLTIRIGGNLVIKKTTNKKDEGTWEKKSCENAAERLELVKKENSAQRRSMKRDCSETNDSDVEEAKLPKLKRKTSDVEQEESVGTNNDNDSSPVKKRKKSTKCDDNVGGKAVGEDESFTIDEQKCDVEPSVDDKCKIRVAKFAIERRLVKANDYNDNDATESRRHRARRTRVHHHVGAEGENSDKCEVYTCAHCIRSFRRKSNLKRHMLKLHCDTRRADKAGGASVASASTWFTGYCCDICGEGLQVRSTMMAHRNVVHGLHPEIDWVKYQTCLARVKFCVECKKYFRAGRTFDEHSCDQGTSIGDTQLAERLRTAEEIRPAFMCSVCNACFRWKWDFRLHRESEHKDMMPLIDWSTVTGAPLQHVCERCAKAYTSAEQLAAHHCTVALLQQQAADEATTKPFRCKLCGLDYFWKSDFRRHMRTKHPKENYRPTEHDTIVYSCPYCVEQFSLKKRVLLHMRKTHNVNSDSPFVCVQCNKVFRRRDNLDRHNESYHPKLSDADEVHRLLDNAEIRINGDLLYHCSVCSRNIPNPNRFISHYRGHHSENKFTCDLCGKQAKTQHQLNTHIKNIHLNIRNYRCDMCEKSFYTKQSCEEHRRIHTGERPFSCEICGKTFIASNALISHKRFHNDFYPHACSMCPKKFKVRRSLVNHVRTHTGERPFECDLCAKTFNNSSQYSYHKKVTHSESRPYACSVCGNCFKANKFLARHMVLHTNGGQATNRRVNASATRPKIERKLSCTALSIIGSSTVASRSCNAESSAVAAHAASVADGCTTPEPRDVKIVVSAPLLPASPLADVPSIVNVVSTRFFKNSSPDGCGSNVDYGGVEILPHSNALFDAERNYDAGGGDDTHQYVRSANCDPSATSGYVTTVEYVQGVDGDCKTVISERPYSPNAHAGPAGGTVGAGKNMNWL